jgi:hypothetical protein
MARRWLDGPDVNMPPTGREVLDQPQQQGGIMADQVDNMEFDERGGIFQITGQHVYDPANWRAGTMTLNLTNGAGKWIDLIMEATYPAYDLMWQSGRLNDGSVVSHLENMAEHLNKAVHIKRWAPGVFNIPGDGGGEVFFAVPSNGDVTINISVIG